MYRNNGENPTDNISSMLGLNGLNTLGLQDMNLNAENLASAAVGAPSPTTLGDINNLTPLPEQPQLTGTIMGGRMPDMATVLFKQQQERHLLLLQRQQQQQQKQQLAQQQQLGQQQLVQQQLGLTNAVNEDNFTPQLPQKDEISKSLQMFAMFSAYNDFQKHQADVMKEFATNGLTSDCLNRNNANQGHQASKTKKPQNQQQQELLQQMKTTQSWLNLNYADQLRNDRNPWRNAPSSSPDATNETINSNRSVVPEQNHPPNKFKTHKRHNGSNKDKYAAMKHCVFCENNNEPEAVVQSHSVRDSLGRVLCPKLRTYVCPICKASGDKAHTIKYCPKKPIITMEDAIRAEHYRLAKNAYFKQQMKL